ncbi:hypothetical protein LHP98_15015 [Rhodobacter sp. Har01]|uniref:hypothetical protein n=1 Tax=Rhodobacter sp. Har01 TaxID=2883999 RepID=UPI001D081403|nr:hypothetical protein [Rhodobacter sp. Har01]MCB6179431.1 hypothetical protein [Rhodobacter sp. Har01]
MRLALLTLPLALAACVGPQLNAGLSIGPNGARVYPSVSAGLEGGGTISYSP